MSPLRPRSRAPGAGGAPTDAEPSALVRKAWTHWGFLQLLVDEEEVEVWRCSGPEGPSDWQTPLGLLLRQVQERLGQELPHSAQGQGSQWAVVWAHDDKPGTGAQAQAEQGLVQVRISRLLSLFDELIEQHLTTAAGMGEEICSLLREAHSTPGAGASPLLAVHQSIAEQAHSVLARWLQARALPLDEDTYEAWVELHDIGQRMQRLVWKLQSTGQGGGESETAVMPLEAGPTVLELLTRHITRLLHQGQLSPSFATEAAELSRAQRLQLEVFQPSPLREVWQQLTHLLGSPLRPQAAQTNAGVGFPRPSLWTRVLQTQEKSAQPSSHRLPAGVTARQGVHFKAANQMVALQRAHAINREAVEELQLAAHSFSQLGSSSPQLGRLGKLWTQWVEEVECLRLRLNAVQRFELEIYDCIQRPYPPAAKPNPWDDDVGGGSLEDAPEERMTPEELDVHYWQQEPFVEVAGREQRTFVIQPHLRELWKVLDVSQVVFEPEQRYCALCHRQAGSRIFCLQHSVETVSATQRAEGARRTEMVEAILQGFRSKELARWRDEHLARTSDARSSNWNGGRGPVRWAMDEDLALGKAPRYETVHAKLQAAYASLDYLEAAAADWLKVDVPVEALMACIRLLRQLVDAPQLTSVARRGGADGGTHWLRTVRVLHELHPLLRAVRAMARRLERLEAHGPTTGYPWPKAASASSGNTAQGDSQLSKQQPGAAGSASVVPPAVPSHQWQAFASRYVLVLLNQLAASHAPVGGGFGNINSGPALHHQPLVHHFFHWWFLGGSAELPGLHRTLWVEPERDASVDVSDLEAQSWRSEAPRPFGLGALLLYRLERWAVWTALSEVKLERRKYGGADVNEIRRLQEQGLRGSEIAKQLGISYPALRMALARDEKKGGKAAPAVVQRQANTPDVPVERG